MLHDRVWTQEHPSPATLMRQTSESTGLTPAHRSRDPGTHHLSDHLPFQSLLNQAGLPGQGHNTSKQTAFHF